MRFYSIVLLVVTIAAVHSIEIGKSVKESVGELNKGQLRYVIYSLKDGVQSDVEDSGPPSESFKDMAAKIGKHDDSRYGMIDYEYEENGSPVKKRVLILWSPETATAAEKEIFRNAYDEKHAAAAGIDYFVQFNEKSELTDENLIAKLKVAPAIPKA
ncbi:actophorin-like [Neodiprion virginianus]|uniref:actophorin-like n=1 Tax=Neodiprion virginianus TaxID=2961670 RepID=UPI001EE6A417|nr:actophorin-like [Neodiprion virginianus]